MRRGAGARRRASRRGKAGRPRAEKVCPVCERPFHWRARWRHHWEAIVYCSRRCANQRTGKGKGKRIKID